MIPKVRDWKVRYLKNDGSLVCETVVATINKRFAQWQAQEDLGYPLVLRGADKVTVSLVR